jgi:4-hydroxy-tetrahydrodipicolinate synthase
MFKGSIPALVTPMRDDGAIDFDAWDALLDFHLREGSDGIVVGGTTGESPVLDRAELE